MSAFSKFRMALLGVLTVMMAGVLGYRFFEDYTWFESLYMTTITLSTVGFQEVRPLSQIRRLLTIILLVSGLDEQVLMNAGVMRARGLFATLSTDANNVFVTLTAKQLNPNLTIVARAEAEQSQKTLMRAGADKVISPYAMGGHRMAQAALCQRHFAGFRATRTLWSDCRGNQTRYPIFRTTALIVVNIHR